MKLHLGCGPNVKDGYLNIDRFVQREGVLNLDILNLPYEDNSADEILSEHMAEHLRFKDEGRFWNECHRLLKKGGKLIVETPDFEWLCQTFLEARDDFTEFYQVGSLDHYFGHGKSLEHRWSILTTHFFGNQNGDGQFHCNAYTEQKMKAIAKMLGFQSCSVERAFHKGTQAIIGTFIK